METLEEEVEYRAGKTRRFHVKREALIETNGELRVDLVPRSRKAGARTARLRFRKPEQFELAL